MSTGTGDTNWAEGGISTTWRATNALRITGAIGAYTGTTPEPGENATLGLNLAF